MSPKKRKTKLGRPPLAAPTKRLTYKVSGCRIKASEGRQLQRLVDSTGLPASHHNRIALQEYLERLA